MPVAARAHRVAVAETGEVALVRSTGLSL